MNKQQINQYDMYLRIQTVMNAYTSVWQGNSRIKANFSALESAIQAIDENQRKKGTGHSNLYQSKAQLKGQLIEISLRVIKAVQSYATDEKNTELHAAVNYSKTDFLQARESQLPNICRVVHSKTSIYLAQLLDYGITDTLLTELQGLTDQFKDIVPQTQVTISQGKVTTESMVGLFKQTNHLLRDQLDGKIEQFKTSQTAFYNAYFNARTVLDRAKIVRLEEK
jgi:hypothetical protein